MAPAPRNDPESAVLTFDTLGPTTGRVSYPLAAIKSASWKEDGEGFAFLELALESGETRIHRVMTPAAINVCERVGS